MTRSRWQTLGAGCLAAALPLAGCMLGPNYVRPHVAVPAAYRFPPQEAARTIDTAWWRQFDDPVLDKLIAEALAHNPSTELAAANVEAAAAVLTQTRAPLFPQVGYSGEAAREQVSKENATPVPNGVANPQNAFQLLAGASWELDLWGRIRRQSEAARASLLGTEEARRGVLLSLVGSVATSYIQLLGLDDELRVAKATQRAYGESLHLFELQFQHGQVSEMEVAQAKSQYYTAVAQVPAIEQQIAQTEDALSTLLGRNPGPIVRGRTIRNLHMPAVPAGLPSQLLDRRPDIAQAEQQLIAANAQIGAAKALYFPSISLTGAFGTASADLSNLFKGAARTWSFAGTFAGPIFTAGSVSGQVAQAEALQKAALSNYRQTIQRAFADVSDALSARENLSLQTKAQIQLVAALQNYSRLAHIQYDGGYVPYSTVLQADQQLFPAELTLAATRASYFNALVRVYTTMGGGWIDIANQYAPQPKRGSYPLAPAIPKAPGASASEPPAGRPNTAAPVETDHKVGATLS
jgi:multidrug efflux system outer membrane protein